MAELTPEEQKKQEYYRDARTGGYYGDIWTTVGKCVFCDMRDKYIVHEENGIVMTVALYAYIDGNVMIVPRRHVRSIKELNELEWATVRKFMYLAKKMIRKVHDIKGLQYMIRDGGIEAQSTVSDHLHIHCIPFDAPDLSTWNYRKLKYTPLENANLYKHARKDIIKHDGKFVEKYQQSTTLPIVCDLILVNDKQEILVEERADDAKLYPDTLTPPGGTLDNAYNSLEDELIRELKEELNLTLKPEQLTLLTSRLETRTIVRRSETLRAAYKQKIRYVWNTYFLDDFKAPNNLKAGDDCKTIIWMPLAKAVKSPQLSPEFRATIELYLERKKK